MTKASLAGGLALPLCLLGRYPPQASSPPTSFFYSPHWQSLKGNAPSKVICCPPSPLSNSADLRAGTTTKRLTL
ncbi:hypothetical protein BJY04DRAFT_183592 [Aspergillus karnatakaensis]|uniref:uncharacterized protein n=1 Tax=Aspergillus karnatakaensis TaxID=1810916 RepID=UPI003CCD3266